MGYRVRDWINAQNKPLPNSQATDYDADAIRLLLDDLGDKYRQEFPDVYEKVQRIKRQKHWVPKGAAPHLCSQGHVDPPWSVRKDNRGRLVRVCKICNRDRSMKYARRKRRRR
jgi:hypothetical protein